MNQAGSADTTLGLAQGLEKTRWQGQWIWTDETGQARNVYALFRRRFSLGAETVLNIALTADSFYELHVDGQRLGRGPARAHLDYYGFDRHTIRLSAGEHVLAVLVHHIGVLNATIMTGRPGLLVEVDGRGICLGTDTTWRCVRAHAWRTDLPCLMSHFGFWEECDQALLPAGWIEPHFDDSAWSQATVVGQPPCPPWPRLIEPDIPLPRQTRVPVRCVAAAGTWAEGLVLEDEEAKRRVVAGGWLAGAGTTEIPSKQAAVRRRTVAAAAPGSLPRAWTLSGGSGAWLTLDFGRTVSGYPLLTIESAEVGVVVDLSYDDVLGADGAVNPERTYARQADRFRLAAGRSTVRPVHPRGFRFVTVDLAGTAQVTVQRAEALEETYPFADRAAFHCADAALEAYAATAAETVRICTTDAFTDCASRERVQWMEDLYQHARVAAYAFGDTKLLRRALFQGAQNALPDGRINGFMPSERTGCAFASSSLVWLHLLADYWLFAGDEAGCRQLLPSARRVLDRLAACSDAEQLIVTWPSGQFWDWSPIEGQGCLLLTNAFHAWALDRLAEHDLFRQGLGPDLQGRAEAIRRAAHAHFWNADRRLYRDAPPRADRPPIFSQHANALAVLAGICPAAERAPLLRRVTDPSGLGPVPVGEHALNDRNRPDLAQIVPVGTLWFGHFLCQALFEAGLDSEALVQMRLLWGPYECLPTFPETRQAGANTTQCHGWAAGPAWLLPAYVLGVRPTAAGWRRVRVAPHAGGLAAASGRVPTPLGPVEVTWCHGANGVLALDVKVPAGVQLGAASAEN